MLRYETSVGIAWVMMTSDQVCARFDSKGRGAPHLGCADILQAADDGALGIGSRVALRCHDNGQRHLHRTIQRLDTAAVLMT